VHVDVPLQLPLDIHTRYSSPFNVNPSLQLMKANSPYVVPFGVETFPFVGAELLQSENKDYQSRMRTDMNLYLDVKMKMSRYCFHYCILKLHAIILLLDIYHKQMETIQPMLTSKRFVSIYSRSLSIYNY
jgi:hypothetical protein